MPDSPVPDFAAEQLSGQITAHTDEALFQQVGVRVAFTERGGGFSQGRFASLNLKKGLGDDDRIVARNQSALRAAFGCLRVPCIVPNQVHGTRVLDTASASPVDVSAAWQWAQEGCDGVVVGCAGLAALLCYADCLPLVLVAPTGDFAVVHCGWRGTVAGIASKALGKLAAQGRCDASQVNAYIGPYIHEECFEVGQEVAQQFEEAFGVDTGVVRMAARVADGTRATNDLARTEGLGSIADPSVLEAVDTLHVNLAKAVQADLCNAGMVEERIADVDICTVCTTDRFFSYRTEGGDTGRHGAFAVRL